MILVILISLLILLAIYLLFAPVSIHVDTFSNHYYLRQPGTFSAVVYPDDQKILKIQARIFFYNFSIFPLDQIRKKRNGKEKSDVKKRVSRKQFSIEKVKRFIRTFKINELLLDIDTGDYVKNAQIYPVFYFLNYGKAKFRINFEGRVALKIDAENRPVNVLKLFV